MTGVTTRPGAKQCRRAISKGWIASRTRRFHLSVIWPRTAAASLLRFRCLTGLSLAPDPPAVI